MNLGDFAFWAEENDVQRLPDVSVYVCVRRIVSVFYLHVGGVARDFTVWDRDYEYALDSHDTGSLPATQMEA